MLKLMNGLDAQLVSMNILIAISLDTVSIAVRNLNGRFAIERYCEREKGLNMYFKVEESHVLAKEYREYQKNFSATTELAKKFFDEKEIKPELYRAMNNTIRIKPSAEDKLLFGPQLCLTTDDWGAEILRKTAILQRLGGRCWQMLDTRYCGNRG